MSEQDIRDWRLISACLPLLHRLIQDLSRLSNAHKRLVAKQEELVAAGLDPDQADDAAVRAAVSTLVKHASLLVTESDYRGKHAPHRNRPRYHEFPATVRWLGMVSAVRKTARSLVIDFSSEKPLDEEYQGYTRDWLIAMRDLAQESLRELERVPDVQSTIYADLLLKQDRLATETVAAEVTEPGSESLTAVEITSRHKGASPDVPDANFEPSKDNTKLQREASSGDTSDAKAEPSGDEAEPENVALAAGTSDANVGASCDEARPQGEALIEAALDVNAEPSRNEVKPQDEASGSDASGAKARPSGDGDNFNRPCYKRDQQFLRWKLDEHLGEAAIRDRWNKLSEEERKEICPADYGRVGDGDKKKGREVVKTALKKASGKVKKIPKMRKS